MIIERLLRSRAGLLSQLVRTQVAIVGAGPAGTLLAHLLGLAGIEHVVVERQTRRHVLERVRAGVLEAGTVQVLRDSGLGERMDREGHVHDTINIAWRGEELLALDTVRLVGRPMMAYGQTKIQEDLYAAADAAGTTIHFEAGDVEVHDVETDSPSVTFGSGDGRERIECDVVAGCDGFHGVSRSAIPAHMRTEYEKVYPFGWLGVLSETPPLPIILYANHRRGFALCSMRTPMLSRHYVQCRLDETVDDWPDDRFWTELTARIPASLADGLVTGPSIEKSITPLRSFVSEPMRHGRLFLAGDAAHIVPPTGAKGLNLAVSDVFFLSRALAAHYAGDDRLLDAYSDMALRRVWGAVRFSWWLTMLLHRFPDQTAFDQRAQEQELSYLASSVAAQTAMVEQYVGLPFEQ
jgi:p-hydroxybenzoate 3-monooxygenase